MLAVVAIQMPAHACSPALISPLDALQAPGPTARFDRIVLAEVVAARAPARRGELQRWREQVRSAAAAQARAEAELAAQIKIADDAPPGVDDPPQPPPPTAVLPPVLPLALDLRTEVDLFVLETLYGAHQDWLSVPAGGPCGSTPTPGQQVLVFIQADGLAFVLQRAGTGGSQSFDAAFLDQVRACARGECEQPVR